MATRIRPSGRIAAPTKKRFSRDVLRGICYDLLHFVDGLICAVVGMVCEPQRRDFNGFVG